MSKFKKLIVFVMILLTTTLLLPNVSRQNLVSAKGIRLNYSSYRITAGGSFKLKVKGTKKKVKWKSSKKKIATVSKKGKVKAKKKGKCVITAKVGGKKLKCKVTVKKNKNVNFTEPKTTQIKEFTAVTLDVSELRLDVNSITYNNKGKISLTGKKGTFKLSVLNSSKPVIWKTSNANVAKVDNGTVTAVAKGSCTVSAVISGKSYQCAVTVTDLRDEQQIANQEHVYYVLSRLNYDRVKAKSQPVKVDTGLNKVADIRAEEVSRVFSHTRPDGTPYKTAYDDAGVKISKYGTLGEVVSFCSDRVEYVGEFPKVSYDALYDNIPHRKAMMNPNYNYVGIGSHFVKTFYNDNGNLAVSSYWTIEFSAQ